MVKKHFFPEMFGDLWGVICYHYWYLREGLEGQKKTLNKINGKKNFEMMQIYPLSIFHPSVQPESLPEADLSTFQKITFSLFSEYFGFF